MNKNFLARLEDCKTKYLLQYSEMGSSPILPKDSYSRAMQHVAQGSSDADKALGALSIALMCEEGNIPQDSTTVTETRECLFAALMNEAAQVKVGASCIPSCLLACIHLW